MTNALIVCNFQTKYVEGPSALHGALQAVPIINNLISLFMDHEYPVIYTQRVSADADPHGSTAIYPGVIHPINYAPMGVVKIKESVTTDVSVFAPKTDGTLYLEKFVTRFDNLHSMLVCLGVEHLTFVGMSLDMTVYESALNAYALGYNVFVPTSATAMIFPGDQRLILNSLVACGVNVEVGGNIYVPDLTVVPHG